MKHPDEALVADALARRPEACRALIERLKGPIQRQVNGALIRAGQGTRQDVRDLVQEVFRILLDEDGKVLRAWRPDGGASLEGYVGLVAQRQVVTILRSGRKSGYAEDPHGPERFDSEHAGEASPEALAMSRQSLALILDELRRTLSPKGFELFHWLYVEDKEVSWVMEKYELSQDGVYKWRSRLSRAARDAAEKISSGSRASPRSKLRRAGHG